MRIWSANRVLIGYLQKHPIERGSRVLEIGCGAGMAGIYCAKAFDARVIAMDIDETVFPRLYACAEKNGVRIATAHQDFALLTTEDLRGTDVLLGVEVTAWWWIVESIRSVMDRARDAEVKRILFADPGRETFYAAMRERPWNIHPWHVNGKHRIYGRVYDEIVGK